MVPKLQSIVIFKILDISDEMATMPQVERDRDGLLEERRKQRAALRAKRRKETREREKAEAEIRKDNEKTKEKDLKSKRLSTKYPLLVTGLPGTSSPGLSGDHDGPLTNVAFSALAGSTSKKAAQLKTASNPT
ncbi:hypothetical protein HD554DRAFT_2173777 [Boletus coccyginus]|nr:hypothetical protein HD554DRAFT_2173777 [Boletus coccyginus]